MSIVRSTARTIVAICAVLSLGIATHAQACRSLVLKPADLAEYTTIVLTTVESANRVDNVGWNTWMLTTRAVRTVAGSPTRESYAFKATLSSDGCGMTALPNEGESWVVYENGFGQVRGYPLSFAKQYDPRLAEVS